MSSRETFSPLIGSRFTFWSGDEPVGLVLDDVLPLGGAPGDADSFTLEFSGPSEIPLSQGTYPVEQQAVGQTALFIVPVGRGSGRMLYEAVFNRSTPS